MNIQRYFQENRGDKQSGWIVDSMDQTRLDVTHKYFAEGKFNAS